MFVTDAASNIMERDSVETVASRINPEGFAVNTAFKLMKRRIPSSYKMWEDD
jgi:hypothetical protein